MAIFTRGQESYKMFFKGGGKPARAAHQCLLTAGGQAQQEAIAAQWSATASQ